MTTTDDFRIDHTEIDTTVGPADLRDFGALLALPPGGPVPAHEAWMDWRAWA